MGNQDSRPRMSCTIQDPGENVLSKTDKVHSRLEKILTSLIYKTSKVGIPQITLVSLDDDIVFSSVTVIHLLTLPTQGLV